MFTIITQDGRTLTLLKGYKVEFRAVQYIGHINYNYAEAFITRSRKKCDFTVKLAEFANYADAERICKILDNDYRSRDKTRTTKFFMPGSVGIAPNDDLMATIAELDECFPKGWHCDFDMIDGKTTSAYNRVPDSSGSYRNALIRMCEIHGISLDTKEALSA